MTGDWLEGVRSLLEAPSPAVLTTYRKDGSALVSPVWYRWHDGGLEVVIAKDQATANLTLTSAKDAPSWVGRLTLTAETDIDGKSATFPVIGLTMVRPTIVRRCEVVAAVLGKGTP